MFEEMVRDRSYPAGPSFDPATFHYRVGAIARSSAFTAFPYSISEEVEEACRESAERTWVRLYRLWQKKGGYSHVVE